MSWLSFKQIYTSQQIKMNTVKMKSSQKTWILFCMVFPAAAEGESRLKILFRCLTVAKFWQRKMLLPLMKKSFHSRKGQKFQCFNSMQFEIVWNNKVWVCLDFGIGKMRNFNVIMTPFVTIKIGKCTLGKKRSYLSYVRKTVL